TLWSPGWGGRWLRGGSASVGLTKPGQSRSAAPCLTLQSPLRAQPPRDIALAARQRAPLERGCMPFAARSLAMTCHDLLQPALPSCVLRQAQDEVQSYWHKERSSS